MTAAAVAVREGPIPFMGEMVRAILDDRKTKTRRVVKIPKRATFDNCAVRTWDEDADKLRGIAPEPPDIAPFLLGKRSAGQYLVCNLIGDVGIERVHCPHGRPGDRLWVREALRQDGVGHWKYDADRSPLQGDEATAIEWITTRRRTYCPPMFMPRWACRITLEITNVSVERVQRITEADAEAEGAEPILVPPDGGSCPHVEGFRDLWDRINAKRGFGWNVDPFVWVIEFRKVASC